VIDATADPRSRAWAAAIVFIVVAFASIASVGRDLDSPGLYYDEVIQAEPAIQFLADDGVPSAIPGARTVRLFGGWFPVLIQPYMGALKSQVLIPVFAVFAPTAATLRISTMVLAAIGVLFAALWVRRILGAQVAWVTTLLLVSDASLLYVARHDWGSFSLGLVCRCGGLLLLTNGWIGRSAARLFAGGLLLGLGVYNKIDFGVFLVGVVLAWAASMPRALAAGVRDLRSRGLPVLLGAVLGAAPMIAGAAGVLSATRNVVRRQAQVDGDWSEKIHTLVATLDGSYFQKLILAGGSFERMFDPSRGVQGLLGLAFLVGSGGLCVWLWRERRRGQPRPVETFVLLAAWLIAIGLLLTPRAVRIHHALNLYPFPHIVVAVACVRLGAGRSRGARVASFRRGLAAAVVFLVVAFNLAVAHQTAATIVRTGGKGRWSSAIGDFAVELGAGPPAVAVGMDWGFAGPMRFASRTLAIVEPIWTLRRMGRSISEWQFDGTRQTVYLVFEEPLAVFGFAPQFLAFAEGLGSDRVSIQRHVDREGDVAFLSIRFAGPHRLIYRDGFEVQWK